VNYDLVNNLERIITTIGNPKCDEWCELGIWLNAAWKGGCWGFVANDNGHH
jgi:hypothetical protein